MTSRNRMSTRPILLLGLVLQAMAVGQSFAQDLSILSDFGSSEIVQNGSLIVQTGTSNSAQISQMVDAGGSKGHYAEITQDGSDNQAAIDQSGDLNRARITQPGSSNFANSSQTGYENYFDLSQSGYGNAVYATQTGNNNSIVFSQPGSATAKLVEIGNNNSIIGTQGLNSIINIRLEGNGLTATVRQN